MARSYDNPTNPAFGLTGFEYINNTAAHTGDFFAIQFIEDTVIAAITANPALTGNAFVGDTFPAGLTIYCQHSSITLTSGRVICYKADV
jgi:hypothetical protein